MYNEEYFKKLRTKFLTKTDNLRNQIDNKKEKIEREQKILRNHQKKFNEQLETYKNEVNRIITKLTLQNDVNQSYVKSIYNYLMDGLDETGGNNIANKSNVSQDESLDSSSDNISQSNISERSSNQNY